MNAHCHCTTGADNGTPPPTLARRSRNYASWLVPSVMLAVLPKCPACLAAYVAFGTGVSLSFTTASSIKTLLVIMCVATLIDSVARSFPRLISLMFTARETSQ